MKFFSKLCAGILAFGVFLFILGTFFGGHLHIAANNKVLSLGRILEHATHEIVREFNDARHEIKKELFDFTPIIHEKPHLKGW